MNSSLQKALISSVLAIGGCASVIAQGFPVYNGGYDWDVNCIDPNNTAPYSNPFASFQLETPFWAAGVGLYGSVAYYKLCPMDTNATGGSLDVAGSFGFANGPLGSIQDDFRLANGDLSSNLNMDNGATFTPGMNTLTDPFFGPFFGVPEPGGPTPNSWNPLTNPGTGSTPNSPWTYNAGGDAVSGSDWSFVDVVTESTTGVLAQAQFGSGTLASYFEGASNRYAYREEVQGTITILLVMDVLGDTSRLTWSCSR